MTWATPNAETENVRSISEMVGATVATVASNSITHPVPNDRVFYWSGGVRRCRVGLLTICKSTKVSQRPINSFTKLKIQNLEFEKNFPAKK